MLNENDTMPVNSSPKNKSSSGLLSGLWSKRSTKVEPHPLSDGELSDSCVNYGIYNNIQQPKSKPDTSFAKCSPKSISKSQSLVNNTENYYHKLPKNSNNINKNNNNNLKGNNNNNNNNKNNNLVSTRENTIKNISANNETLYNSDIRPTVNLRVKSSNKSTNISNLHNRLSHQFILCCKAGDQKQLSPAVSVRYNSIPDVLNEQTKTALREHMVLNLDGITSDSRAPLAQVTETNSAPETPINPQKSDSFNSQSSPSTQSIQSVQSINDGQPRAIAITACRSRLRLKLLPPGKPIVNEAYLTKSEKEDNSLNSKNINGIDDDNISERTVLAEQHLSSPDISRSNNEFPNKDCQQNRSLSFDRIQQFQTFQKNSHSGSTDLARQALMAAQVLNLIPTEKARERNFLANRLASCSLLGASELTRVLPNKEITIFVGTWNMNGQSPPKQMNDFVLPASMEHVPDLIVIGTQESCPERFEWEVTLQETLGPSHVLFHAANLGTLHLAVFIRRDLIWFCSVPEEANLSVRPGTAFRTKGAVAISFCLFGTSMLFVTSHLTAHQQKVKERVQDVKRIIHALDLPRNLKIRHKNKDVTQNFDSVFWCGDLNFRLSEPREKLLKWIETTKFPLPSHLPHGYMHTDQLKSVLSDGAAFKGFMEANITFPPTYKFDPGTQQFDTSSKQRAPAYTDRILYKYRQSTLALRRASVVPERFLSASSHTEPPLSCIAYDSVPSITTSDHKPVWALFRNTIKPGIDSIPLAAGLFLRDVYVEGMRRRLNHSYTGSSAVCSIQ